MKLPKDKKVFVIGMSGLEEELREEDVSYTGGTVSVAFIALPLYLVRILGPILQYACAAFGENRARLIRCCCTCWS
jgi:hypothetical protein